MVGAYLLRSAAVCRFQSASRCPCIGTQASGAGRYRRLRRGFALCRGPWPIHPSGGMLTNAASLRILGVQDMVWIEGGSFLMGSEDGYPEEAPVREVAVEGFWIDRYAVTNRDWNGFVKETGHVTLAER